VVDVSYSLVAFAALAPLVVSIGPAQVGSFYWIWFSLHVGVVVKLALAMAAGWGVFETRAQPSKPLRGVPEALAATITVRRPRN